MRSCFGSQRTNSYVRSCVLDQTEQHNANLCDHDQGVSCPQLDKTKAF